MSTERPTGDPSDLRVKSGQQRILPATFAQQRLWFLDQLQPGGTAYMVSWSIHLDGVLDIGALEQTLNELVRRHGILRTTFAMIDGEIKQVIAEAARVELPVEHFAHHDDARKAALAEAQTPIDLAHGPMVRARLQRLAAEEHVLLITLHHIIFDGSSRAVLTRDFAALYDAFREGRPSPLPDPSLQYGDYAVWQHRALSGKNYQKLLSYWKKQLADPPASLALPTDRPRPAVETFRGGTLPFGFSKHLSEGIEALARKQRSSLFMTLLGSFQALLSKYSGQEDLIVGVPVAGRTRKELEGVIGLFANELALRVKLSGDPTFEEVISRAREAALDGYEHQDMPFDKLVQEINPERSLSRNPLFQVLFSVRNYEREALHLSGLAEVTFAPTIADTSKFDLSLYITESADGISGWMEYNTDLFDEATIGRMLGHLRVLLEAAVANPGLRLSELPLLTPEEEHQILVEWNDTAVSYPRELSLHEFIEQQVERTPDATALVFDSLELTYRELNARANQLARRLRSLGVGPETLVAVCAERSVEMVVALLGTVKAGGAYVPIDPDYPRARLADMLADSEPRVLLTLERLLDVVPEHQIPTICLDRDWHTVAGESSENLPVLTSGKDQAYVIYTSGSTGKPKGVPNVHEGIVNRLLWMQDAYRLDASDRVLQKTPYSFDVSVWEFFWPLMTGACLVVARPEGHKDPNYLVSLIRSRGITTLHFVPSMLRIFLESADVERCTSLRRVICSGEALPFDLQERFFERLGAELHNLYGPTEAAVDVTFWHCTPHSGRSIVPIGKPIWNTQIYVLDKNLRPVPAGIAGELHIGGVNLARGYLKRPELTEQKFIPDPFRPEAGARLYKTGDLSRFLPDGNVEYLGRMDDQVKLRGFRIELGEIEAVLAQHPSVKDCVVIVREDVPGDKRLVAYLVPATGQLESGDSGLENELSGEQVAQWAMTFDESYRQGGDAADATFNIAGWNSSYTGGAIPAGEMRVWVDSTVDRILALRPKSVWEIGCGTGLLLFPVARQVDCYHGTDVSQTALTFLRQQLSRPELHLPVTLERRPAHQFEPESARGKFDLVVINSVIQYFPDLDYLVKVLEGAVESVAPEGAVFVGDVRSLPLLRTFHTSVQLSQAPDSLTRAQLLQRVEKEIQQEGELVVDPEFFAVLRQRIPRITRVEVQLKRGIARNELTRFRYDVILHVGKLSIPTVDPAWLDWTKLELTLPLLREILEKTAPDMLGLTRVPNARLLADVAAQRLLEAEDGPATLGKLRETLQAERPANAVEPEELWQLEADLPYKVEIRASRTASDGFCDVMLRRTNTSGVEETAPAFPGASERAHAWESYATNPLRQKLVRALVPQVRESLDGKLPEYMVPSAFVLLDSIPLSNNGKVNRRALPQPEYAREANVTYVAPRTGTEQKLAEIWSEVLHIARIGVEDNFFALGGHSLLGTQAVSRIRETFGIDLPLRALFEAPTVAGLAAKTEALQREQSGAGLPALRRSERQGGLPLSFAQQRLWFLDQLEPLNPLYNVTSALRMRGELKTGVLEDCLNEIVKRHETLRTRFALVNGEPVQLVEPWQHLPLTQLEARNEDEARELARVEAKKPFSLGQAPLIRTSLVRVAEDDHVLVVITHHIISDGWSFAVLVGELRALYEALLEHRPSPLPELAVQYADYALWQQQGLSGERLEEQLAYWKQQLAGAPAVLEIPTDRPHPPVESFRGAKRAMQLPGELLEKLQALSRSEGATLFMTLLGAFSVLLSRYSGQEEVVVGSPISGRNHSELEKLIGLFVNTIVLRTSMEGDPQFRELLGRVRETAMGAYAHQELPFEKLVVELSPDRDLSRNPLFQAMLILLNVPVAGQRFAGATVSPFPVDNPTSKFDLTLLAYEYAGGLRTTFEYSTDLFEAATIDRMLGHYKVLLSGIVNRPETRVSELPLLTADERKQILVAWNATGREYSEHACLHVLFERQAASTPDAVACVFEDESLNYDELNRRANQVAHYLISLGAGPGQRIGIYVERSLEMMVGLLGIQKTGAAYVPLDPAYPAERIRLTLEDAHAILLLTQAPLLASLPEQTGTVVCLDRDRERIASEKQTNPICRATPDDLVYVIFTSGSTGRPKGVQVPHRAVVNLMAAMAAELTMGPADVFPALASFAFDMCIPELYLALVTGGRVVLGPRGLAGDGEGLAAFLRRHHATVVHATPTTWNLLLEAGYTGKGLKRAIGAEALPQDLCRRLLEADASLYNFYGPTETTVWSAMHHFTDAAESVVIGRPLANTQIYILDRNLMPVPAGVPGEIHIAGAGLARGYLNRPELTAEKFVADPFAARPGAQMYKTGDLGRFLEDGRIEFWGRADFQVKVRGYRIELGEIETVLGRHESVRECVVVAREDVPGDKRLVGYVVPIANQSVQTAELRAWMKSLLPEYMVPVAIVEMERLPLTPNGKVDRKNLPAPEYRRSDLEREFIGPRTPAEEIVAGIWAEVLKLDRVGVEDNFFELGGHSLLGTQVVSRLREAFRVQLPLRALFGSPTVAGLAERIGEMERGGEVLPPLRPRQWTGPLPLSFAQQRLWFLNELDPADASYNVPYIRRLRGILNVPALEESLGGLVRRHDTLRTRFETVNDEPVQLVDAWQQPELAILNAGSEDEARRLAAGEARRPFDLKAGPLLRATVIRIAEDDQVLVLNTHHIISDGWSLGVMAREISALYEAALNNERAILEPLPVQYADYAVWQHEYLSGERLENELRYWVQQLGGAPRALELPADRPRPAVATAHGAIQRLLLPKDVLEGLRRVSREQGATLYMTLLGAFSVFLARYSGQEDIVVGSPIAGRNQTGIENLIGVFVNTLALRTDVSGNPSFRELLARVRETTMSAYAHQDLPFEKLVQILEPDRDMSRHPVFQVMLVLQNIPGREQQLRDISVEPFPANNQTSKFDLTLLATELPDGLRLNFEYNTDLFDASTMERMLGNLGNLLRGIAAQPEERISELPLLGEEEARLALGELHGPPVDFPRERCIHQLFEEQVARNPRNVAVQFEGQQLTYEEMNRRANQVAHHLRKHGVMPDTLVAIYMERSLEMVVAILGVLKAGAGYLPLDPVYPNERLAFMLDDAQVPILLTQAELAEQLPPHNAVTVCLDRDWPTLALEPAGNLVTAVKPEHTAYVIYTSGSTGKPKGVVVTHENVARLFSATDHWFGFSPDDTWTFFHSFAFDFSVWEIWGALLYGGKLIVVPRLTAQSPEQFHALLVQHGVTVLNQTPSAFRQLIVADEQSDRSSELVLRYVIFGGEALEFKTLLPWIQRHGEKPALINMYGITETTVHVTYFKLVNSTVGEETASVIGTPIPDLRVYVLDPHLKPVPVGVKGEMFVGGHGVARGYLKRPELTNERFILNPFPSGGGKRLYRTGDLARVLGDGNIQYLGRIDHQVKIRGFRIELGEIEKVLEQHPSLRECVVIAREDVPGEQRLVAYLVPREGQAPAASELRKMIQVHLPDYMVPASFVFLPVLPLTANGKVDRKALPAPEYAPAEEDYLAPRNPLEEMVASIWAEVLRLPRVGVTDNFFEIGGHSLFATQVISRIRKAFQVQLPLRTLFESPTVAAIADWVERMHRGKDELAAPPIVPVPRRPAPPLSFAQQRLWILDRLEPNNPLYNVPGAYRMAGALDSKALEQALSTIVQRHEVLRTTYREENEQLFQVISPEYLFTLQLVDLTGLPAAGREQAARTLCQEEVGKPFDLAKDAIIRGILVKLDEQDHILLLNTHHIATDGWSLGVLRRELAILYEAALAGESTRDVLPALPVQYADYAAWQRNWMQGEVLESQLSYWRSRLEGAPPVLSVPTERPRPATQTFRGATHTFSLPKELSDRIAALSRREGATTFMTMLAAFKTLLLHYTRQPDIVLGTDVAGRTSLQTEGLIGFFVNLLVLRTDLSGDPSFRELIGRVREVALGAYAHQDVPFDKLVESLQPERSMSHNPLVQMLFVQNTPRSISRMGDLKLSAFRLNTRSKFDMAVFIGETPEGILANWVYNPDLFDEAAISRMASIYQLFLEKVVANPEVKVGDLLHSATAAEQKQRAAEHKGFEEASLQKLQQIKRKGSRRA